MTQVFLSYSHKDLAHATRLAEALKGEFELWWDPNLRSGAAYVPEINDQLAKAKCILVIWSDNALKSRWVTAEAMEGFDSDRLVQVGLNRVMPMVPFKILHCTNCDAPPSPEDISQLKRAIHLVIGEAAAGAEGETIARELSTNGQKPVRPTQAERADAIKQMDTRGYANLYMGFSAGALLLAALLVMTGAALIVASMLLTLSETWTQGLLTTAAVLCGGGVLLMFRSALSFIRAGR